MLRDLQPSKFFLVLTTSITRPLLISEAEILLKLYIILRPSLQSYCNMNLEYREIRNLIIYQVFKMETVQIVSFCVLTPKLLQVETDVSEYSVSIFRDERIGSS
jgi:hypothetical protein